MADGGRPRSPFHKDAKRPSVASCGLRPPGGSLDAPIRPHTFSRTIQSSTLLLTRNDVAQLLSLDECIEAVEHAFRLQHCAKTTIAALSVSGGGFHIKAATLEFDRPYFAAKINANFPLNRTRQGLPTIQGTIALCDAVNGYPLALMDSMEIPRLRTGAASAVEAKYLARSNSRIVTILGCGTQGYVSCKPLREFVSPGSFMFSTSIQHA